MPEQKVIVIIEDEPHHAATLRTQLEAAMGRFGTDVVLLPREPKKTYLKMEEFAATPEGRNPNVRGFIIADLFLAEREVDPVSVFHQLMYNIFPSPTDFSLVCGRLGVLRKIVEYYRRAWVEVYTYFPTYFTTQNEPIHPDRYLHKHESPASIKQFARSHEDQFKTFLAAHREAASGEETGVNLLQTLALYGALEERLRGIFGCADIFEHVTGVEGNCADVRVRGSKKTDRLEASIKTLIDKIEKYLQQA